MSENNIITANSNIAQIVLENFKEYNPKKKLPAYITIHDVKYWRLKAMLCLLDEMTEQYSKFLGKPTNLIEDGPISFSEKIFLSRIIIFEESQI